MKSVRFPCRAWLLCASFLVLAGACSVPRDPPANPSHQEQVSTVEFSVLGMSCQKCSIAAEEALEHGLPALVEASVDFDSRAARLRLRGRVDRQEIRRALDKIGMEAHFQDEPSLVPPPLSDEERMSLDIRTISHGEEVRLEDHLVPGKITLFDYYADWCGPCHLLSPKLERLVQENQKLILRKVDISNWESAAAKQASRDFRMPGIPYVRVYGPDGKLLGDVHGNHIEKIEELVRRGLGQ